MSMLFQLNAIWTGSRGTRGDVSKLQAATIANYQLAITHYNMYASKVLQQSVIQNEKVFQAIATALSDLTKQWVNDFSNLETIYNTHNRFTNIRKGMVSSINLEPTPEMMQALSSNAQFTQGGKGGVFEQYLAQRANQWQQALQSAALNQIEQQYANLLLPFINNLQVSGGVTGESYGRVGKKDIRADLAGGLSGSVDQMADSELRAELNLSTIQTSEQLNNVLNSKKFAYLQQLLNQSAYGYSLKAFDYPLYKHKMMRVVGIRNDLNDKFSNSLTTKKIARSWNANYAYFFMLHRLSELLLNLFGPINIGFFFANGFQWTSTVLREHMAYMRISGKTTRNDETELVNIQVHDNDENLYLTRSIFAELQSGLGRISLNPVKDQKYLLSFSLQ